MQTLFQTESHFVAAVETPAASGPADQVVTQHALAALRLLVVAAAAAAPCWAPNMAPVEAPQSPAALPESSQALQPVGSTAAGH